MGLEYKAWWRFGLENHLLLLDLYYHHDDLSESEIFGYIRKNSDDGSSRPSFVFNQLIKLKFIQCAPDATAFYEVMHLTRLILEFLEREYRFTSAKQIKVYLEEIDTLRQDLEIVFKQENDIQVSNFLRDIANNIEKLRQSSSGNRNAIINAVADVKMNKKNESSTNRYERIMDILERYIKPLEEMIKVDKSLDRSLQQLQILLEHAKREYVFDRDHLDKIKRVALHIPRLRHDLVGSFRESLEEVAPLLDKLQANIFGRGVTSILKNVDKQGSKALDEIVEKLSLPASRIKSDLFDDQKVKIFLHMVKGYKPTPPPIINHRDHVVIKPYIFNQDGLLVAFKSSLPVTDTFDWVRTKYQGRGIKTLLEIYKFIINHAKQYEYGNARKIYEVQEYRISTYPVGIKELN